MLPIVRKATLDDLPTLLLFEQGVIEAERPFDPTIKSGDINAVINIRNKWIN